jgi:hypothetical protein
MLQRHRQSFSCTLLESVSLKILTAALLASACLLLAVAPAQAQSGSRSYGGYGGAYGGSVTGPRGNTVTYSGSYRGGYGGSGSRHYGGYSNNNWASFGWGVLAGAAVTALTAPYWGYGYSTSFVAPMTYGAPVMYAPPVVYDQPMYAPAPSYYTPSYGNGNCGGCDGGYYGDGYYGGY